MRLTKTASALVLSLGIAIQNFPEGSDQLHAAPGDLNTYAAIAFGCPAMGKALAE